MKLLAFELRADWRSFSVRVFAMDDQSPDDVYYAQLLRDADR